MIEVLPALPCEPKPINPADRKINLVAMKEYEAWVGFPANASFWERHDMATAWAERRDFRFDRRAWTETES